MAIETGRERAVFALHPATSRGRLRPEPESASRNAFRRDCDRVIHSAAFRRLKHKTQVFIVHEGDHYRTRLTHTLEVTQIARSLGRALGLDEDLCEALALAHDLGHPPFGHAGEQALDRCLSEYGGFDHNAQTVRVVTSLERRYAEFDGLNLTWETLEGLIKHNGPLADRGGRPSVRYLERGAPAVIENLCRLMDLRLWMQPPAEGQAAAIADDIAYDAHDIDDGLRANLFQLDDLAEVPFVGDLLGEVDALYPGLEPPRRAHEVVRRVITRMIEDVVAASFRRLSTANPQSAEDVRTAGEPVIGFSDAMAEADRGIKGFLFPRMYHHPRIRRITGDAAQVVRDLFGQFLAFPQAMPADWQAGLDGAEEGMRARRVGDFIAGMTDNFALVEHARHFDSTPELR